jgi:hypothetical protein
MSLPSEVADSSPEEESAGEWAVSLPLPLSASGTVLLLVVAGGENKRRATN